MFGALNPTKTPVISAFCKIKKRKKDREKKKCGLPAINCKAAHGDC